MDAVRPQIAGPPKPDSTNEVAARILYHMEGLVAILPSKGKWPKRQRGRVVQAITALIDAHIEVEELAEEGTQKELREDASSRNGRTLP